MIKYRIKLLY